MTLAPDILERLRLVNEAYNVRPFDVMTNPLGIAVGGNMSNAVNEDGNFIAFGRDVLLVGRAMLEEFYSGLARMEQLAAEQAIAAHMLNQVPGVTSFNRGTGDIIFDLPRVYPPGNQSPAPGSVAVLTGGALTLAVVGFNSLGGFTQKSRQALISEKEDFSTIAWDSGVVAGAQLTVTLANAQATLTGGKTYYFRIRQTAAITGEPDFTSLWSAPTSFTFPRAPSVPAMTTPANGAINQGAQNNTIAFAASDYAHPNNVARASRVFEISTTSTFATIVARVAAASGSSVASMPAPTDVLQHDTLYYVRCRDTDENGGTNTSAATTFRTVAAFRPNFGDTYKGGYFVGQINDGGTIFDLIVAPKSGGEATAPWDGASIPTGAASRTNGPSNTVRMLNGTQLGNGPDDFCDNLVLNGYSDWYLPAIDELEIAYRNFKPSTGGNSLQPANGNSVPPGPAYTANSPPQTSVAIFAAGGAEAFRSEAPYWTSTEVNSGSAFAIEFPTGNKVQPGKAASFLCRAFRREAA